MKLEAYRLSQKGSPAKDKRDEKKYMTAEQNKAAIQLLSSPKLMRKTLDLIVKSGLVGQHKNGLLLFLLYLSDILMSPYMPLYSVNRGVEKLIYKRRLVIVSLLKICVW